MVGEDLFDGNAREAVRAGRFFYVNIMNMCLEFVHCDGRVASSVGRGYVKG